MDWFFVLTLVGAPLCLTAYALLHCSVMLYALNVGVEAPNAWQLGTLAREALGILLRWRRELPTFHAGLSPERLFKIDLSTATMEDVLAAHGQLVSAMLKHGYAYTDSQLSVVRRLCIRAMMVTEARAFKEAEQRREQERKAHSRKTWEGSQQAGGRDRRQQSAAGSSNWRQVLGLSAAERDAQVIKKAYRKLASAAHPDRGGSTEAMARLNRAMAAARHELSFV